jgi:hypothetical protein
MTTIAFLGDATTTTALATVACWADDVPALLVEADRSGGSLAAWFDEPVDPSLSSIVATSSVVVDLQTSPSALSWAALDPMVRTSTAGLEHIPLPARSREAGQAVARAEMALFPALAEQRERPVVLDVGRFIPSSGVPRAAERAGAVVVCHRQGGSSPRAAAARLYRLDEMVETVVPMDVPILVALIGDDPYTAADVEEFLRRPESPIDATARSLEVLGLPEDPLCASVLAGRAGVSTRRLWRLPLMRCTERLAARLHGHVQRDGLEVRA